MEFSFSFVSFRLITLAAEFFSVGFVNALVAMVICLTLENAVLYY
jgi:hypothetical protein